MSIDNRYTSKKIATSFAWKLLERGSSVLVSTLVSVLLARLIAPSEFGLLAMISVFVALSNALVSGGVGNSLIQKKDSDALDFSSLFWANIVVALGIYLLLFLCAPYVARFYQYPKLIAILRVLSLNVIIHSINTIQCAYIAKNMLFRNYFFSTLSGKALSGVIGILMALADFGVWALVGQSISLVLIETVILWYRVKWRPQFIFSFKRVKRLYSYSWKLLAMSIMEHIRINLNSLIIGKKYSSSDLAYFNKGDYFPNALITNISTSIISVIFPALSNAQDDVTRRKLMLRRWSQLYAYCALPVLTFLFISAEPLTVFLLTEKWLPSVPYMRLACLAYIAWIIEIPIRESIQSIGRSGICLTMQVIKTVFILTAIIMLMNYGVPAIALATVVAAGFNVCVSAIFGYKFAGYSPLALIADVAPSALVSVVSGVFAYLILLLNLPNLITILGQFSVLIVTYLMLSKLFKLSSFSYLVDFLKKNTHKSS